MAITKVPKEMTTGLENVDNTSDANKPVSSATQTALNAKVNASGGTLTSGSIVTPSRLDVKQDTFANLQTYAITASNGQLVFATDLKQTYQIIDGTLKAVGGAGGINYISNPDFESGTTGYATYADVAGEAPVDGTGGTATFVSIGTDSVSPLRGTKSGLISKTANNAQGQGVSYDFTIDAADQAQILRISFDYSSSTNYADGDIRVYVYDVTNSRLIEVIDRDLLASAQGKFVGTFQTSPDSLSYRLIFHVASVNALAYTVKLDNVIVGPQTIVKGAIVTDWEAYTPSDVSYTWGTVSASSFYSRRNGDSLDVELRFTLSSVVTGQLELSGAEWLPSGLSLDSSVAGAAFGTVRAIDASGGASANDFLGVVINSHSSSSNGIRIVSSTADTYAATVPFTWASGDSLSISIRGAKIQGWSSNVVLSEDAGNREIVLLATDVAGTLSSTSFAYNDLNFTVIQKDTTASYTAAGYTIPESGEYDITLGCAVTYGTAPIAGNDLSVGIKLNSGDYKGSFQKTVGTTTQYYPSGKWTVSLTKGDLVTPYFRKQGTETLSFLFPTDDRFQYFSIAKRSSPQTIAASEVVAAHYTSNSGQVIGATDTTIIFEDVVLDTHNAYNISTGEYTVPQTGIYSISALIAAAYTSTASTNRVQLILRINGNAQNLINFTRAGYVATSTWTCSITGTSINLNKGDVVKITADLSIAGTLGAYPYNIFTISKVNGVS